MFTNVSAPTDTIYLMSLDENRHIHDLCVALQRPVSLDDPDPEVENSRFGAVARQNVVPPQNE